MSIGDIRVKIEVPEWVGELAVKAREAREKLAEVKALIEENTGRAQSPRHNL